MILCKWFYMVISELFPSPAIFGNGVWGDLKKVAQWDWEQFCYLVIWTGFVPAEFKRLNPFQLIIAWTWKLLSILFVFLLRLINIWWAEKDMLITQCLIYCFFLCILIIVQTWTWRENDLANFMKKKKTHMN